MKKLILVIIIAATLAVYSCGNQEGAKNQSKFTPATDSLVNSTGGVGDAAGTASPGSKLIAGNDCKTCHAIDAKLIGPSFHDIANKYENNDAMADELAQKIVKGGYGRWGTVPMTAHPNVSIAQARDMASYVLSLKTK